jgi:hypothetical protein
MFTNGTFSWLEYTNRFKTSSVFQSLLEVSSNDLPQNVSINKINTAEQQN